MAAREIPYRDGRLQKAGAAFTAAIVFACFTLASTSYLAWLYRLLEYAPGVSAEGVTMVGGYSLQAVGIAFMCALIRRWPEAGGRLPFVTSIALHFACASAAMLASTPASLVALGFAMNFLYGCVCAFYLQRLMHWAPREHRGIAFGGGYACSAATTWALSLLQGGNPLGATKSIIACAVLSLLAICLIAASHDPSEGSASSNQLAQEPESERKPVAKGAAALSGGSTGVGENLIPLACITIVLLSLVKNVGFGFPSADLAEGVSLEFSRLFYAVGLLAAGVVADANRRYAAICCVAALALPFGFLALSGESVPGIILWAADYLFFGFFSVYRVVLFCDIAEDTERKYLSGFGLMFGRIGDALGTALWLALGESLVALVAASIVLFAATVFAFYHLFPQLYPAHPAPRKTERERFDDFAAAYDISLRERDVLRLVLAGRTNAEIAGELFITEGTVKYHVHNLFKKTGCSNRRELIAHFHNESTYPTR